MAPALAGVWTKNESERPPRRRLCAGRSFECSFFGQHEAPHPLCTARSLVARGAVAWPLSRTACFSPAIRHFLRHWRSRVLRASSPAKTGHCHVTAQLRVTRHRKGISIGSRFRRLNPHSSQCQARFSRSSPRHDFTGTRFAFSLISLCLRPEAEANGVSIHL